ncbi:MAG TPA: ABC transporter ATP-binding protein [Candidatus Limnocylindrales bacterium]|nr:ABC transporter ATP-binding protein [Candidatus Limnocylindrales bacterium]
MTRGRLHFDAVCYSHEAQRRGGAPPCLSDIRLSVEPSRSLAIVGPNGSGKTTLLRLAAGEIKAASGRIEICGLDPSRAPRREMARRIAVVAAHASVGFGYTVEEVVLMGRAPWVEGYGLESDEDVAIARDAMTALDVAHLSHRIFDSLSSGERQRAAVARALAQQPELLLLDEPGAFLDIKHQIELYDVLLERSRAAGLTVVSVLHDLNLAALYFEDVAMIRDGRIFAYGAPDDVITYANVRAVFDTDVYVDRNHLTGHLNVLPLRRGMARAAEGGRQRESSE